jgi:hypothetical protein
MIHVPAFSSLAGSHDRTVHGARRYTAAQVRALVEAAGLRVAQLSYRNVLALPVAFVRRRLLRVREGSDLNPPPRWLNGLLYLVARLENAWLDVGALPFGLSVWCVAGKPQ